MSAPLCDILFPGAEGWEFWEASARGGAPVRGDARGALRSKRLTVGSPTRTLLAVPLWLPTGGTVQELCELEIASRHLGRRGHRVASVELERDTDRALVLGVLVGDDPEIEPYAALAGRFEAPARLLDNGGAPVVIWKELGAVCFAIHRGGQCVHFATTGEPAVNAAVAGLLCRAAQRLHAEDVIPAMPEHVLLLGSFDDAEAAALAEACGVRVDVAEAPPPRAPAEPAELAPPLAISKREARRRTRRLASVAMIAGALYLGVVAALLGSLGLTANRVREARAVAAADRPQAEAARLEAERWREIRGAVDPSSFALDQFAAVAATLPGETVRFTKVSMGGGIIAIAGEAAEVSQTYDLIEKLKASEALAEYDWTARPPDIAGRNTIRFEIEGRRPDARAEQE